MDFKIKDDLLLGVATASGQIEGGEQDSNWYDFYKRGGIKDNTSPTDANQHYIKYQEDIALMKKMGIQVYRFSVEWCKIQPREDYFDEEVIKHYLEEIKLLKKNNILPMLTLHHFTNPMWFEKDGGFLRDDAPEIFFRFVKYVVDNLGSEIDEYITINEPNVFATNGYFFGIWPPEMKSMKAIIKLFTNFTIAHIKCYNYIHEFKKSLGHSNTKVGFANHLRVFDPENEKNPLHRFFAKITKLAFQDSITEAMMSGECRFPVKKHKDINPGKYYDFIGINYYTRSTVSKIGDGVKKGSPINDLGWEIYPEGLVRIAKEMYEKYQATIFVTENGTCDNNDVFRSKYIYEHLKVISESDLPFTRFCHWSFLDNFEWAEGESARFGIVHCDYETQKRTIKASGDFYSQIIKDRGVSEKSYKKYVENQKYNYDKS